MTGRRGRRVCRGRVPGAVTAPGEVGGCRNLKGSSKVQHYNSVQKRPNKYGHYLDVIAIGGRSNPTETDKSAYRKSPGGTRFYLVSTRGIRKTYSARSRESAGAKAT